MYQRHVILHDPLFNTGGIHAWPRAARLGTARSVEKRLHYGLFCAPPFQSVRRLRRTVKKNS
jgi:hypothetical protein